MVIIVLWVSVELFPGTLSVGLILSKFAQPWRECGKYLWGRELSSQARSESWLVHSLKAKGNWRGNGPGLLARWIAVLRGPFTVNHLAILWIGRRYSHLCSTWNEIQATYWSEICCSPFERWHRVARGDFPNSRVWGKATTAKIQWARSWTA